MIAIGKDSIKTSMNGQLAGVYYYGLTESKYGANEINTKIFGYLPNIQSITYNPFIDMETDTGIAFIECDFDGSYYKWNDGNLPKVYRLTTSLLYEKLLGNFDLAGFIENFAKNNEPRMIHYPFLYFMITDYMNSPLLLKFEHLNWDDDGKLNFKVRLSVSNSSKYVIYQPGYGGDINGNINGLVNNNPLQFPVASSAYASFIATQGNSYANNQALGLAENNREYSQTTQSLSLNNRNQHINNIGGVLGGISSLLAGQIGAGIGQLAGSGLQAMTQQSVFNQNNQFARENYEFKEFAIESSAMAMKQDLLSTPRAIKTIGNDPMYTINNANKKVDLLIYTPNSANRTRLNNYFKRYGVSTNQYKIPYLRSRRYWNFIKFSKCNIDSPNIPHQDLMKLQQIFETGVTLWHVDRGAIIKDYSKDNEVMN